MTSISCCGRGQAEDGGRELARRVLRFAPSAGPLMSGFEMSVSATRMADHREPSGHELAEKVGNAHRAEAGLGLLPAALTIERLSARCPESGL